jgi:hypothetical protein
LDQLDELIRALVGVRQLLELPGEHPVITPTSRLRLVRSLLAFALVLGLTAFASAQSLSESAAAAAQEPSAPEAAPATQATDSDPFKNIKFGTGFEGYYQYNWNRPYDRVNLLRAYDTRANVFSIQQANIIVESAANVDEGQRWGARVDLQFGQATETVQGGAANEPRPDVYRHVWQAYGTYVFPVGRGLTTDFGKFASMLGYETNYAKDNSHFSRAYLFNFLPFYHMGARLSLPVSDTVTLMYMLTNGIQQTEDFNDFKSSHVASIVKPTDKVTWTINYYFGQEQSDGGEPEGPDGFFRVFDTYIAYLATPKLSVGFDANYVTNEVTEDDPSLSLQGTGLYARYQVSSPVAVALRYERLDDEGLFGGIEQVLHEVTATAEYKFAEGFLMRAEFRRDWSNEAFFSGSQPDNLRKEQNTALLGLVWWFGNKQGAW